MHATTDIAPPQVGTRLPFGEFRPRRLAVALVFLALALMPGDFGALTRGLMVDAYTQVSVFVAATLFLFYGAERLFSFDIGTALRNAKGWQVPLAALLGATPGCGGAVVVVAAYSSGNVGFGAVVATLTATMGDAAFLLIATRHSKALRSGPADRCNTPARLSFRTDRPARVDRRWGAIGRCRCARRFWPIDGDRRPCRHGHRPFHLGHVKTDGHVQRR